MLRHHPFGAGFSITVFRRPGLLQCCRSDQFLLCRAPATPQFFTSTILLEVFVPLLHSSLDVVVNFGTRRQIGVCLLAIKPMFVRQIQGGDSLSMHGLNVRGQIEIPSHIGMRYGCLNILEGIVGPWCTERQHAGQARRRRVALSEGRNSPTVLDRFQDGRVVDCSLYHAEHRSFRNPGGNQQGGNPHAEPREIERLELADVIIRGTAPDGGGT